MRRFTLTLALAGLTAAPLHAARDPGLTLHEPLASGRQVGAGARLSLTIPLGQARTAPRRAVLAFDAGPAVSRAGAPLRAAERHRVAPLTRLAIAPGYATTWSLAGQPLVQRRSPAALRDLGDQASAGRANGMSTLGKVGIAVGVVAVAAGVYLAILIDESNTRGDE